MYTQDIQSFDRRSAGYERSFLQVLFFDRVHDATLNLLPAGIQPGSILDIGCGTGRLLRKAAQRWPAAQLFGVDPAEGMINAARQWTPTAVFHVSLAEALSLPDSSVDLVLSTTSFHHWFDQAEGLRQVARVLRPGGWFCLGDIARPYGLPLFARHGRPIGEAGRQAMLEQAGLKPETHRRKMGRFLLVTLARKIEAS
jgi:ubiquinone/menaquinone biosynthesis C-methylase UbiE